MGECRGQVARRFQIMRPFKDHLCGFLLFPTPPVRWRRENGLRISARIASLSKPVSPITTRRRRGARASDGHFAVELVLDARADALHQEPHRLARDLDEALHAQDVVRLGRLHHAVDQLLRRGRTPAGR